MIDKTDTVEDLYSQIEHLIDVPLEQFVKDVEHYQIVPENEERQLNEEKADQQSSSDPVSFKRPILIESDSDEIEEELTDQNQHQYTILTCYKCNKIIPFDSTIHNSLSVSYGSNTNVCVQCASKKRTRSRSFTFEGSNVFSLVADKLKHSFSNNNLLSPNNNTIMHRRKSMPSMNANYIPDSLEPPSPTPSRPSSRASSFFEDVKQLLSPLSRKSSRNSLYQEYQAAPIDTDCTLKTPDGPKRKTSHSSLLEAFHICKPKRNSTSSYERRIISDATTSCHQEDEPIWTQEDDEVLGIHQNNQQGSNHKDDNYLSTETRGHVPLRRKQVKQITSRQERINLYNNAYLDCMQAETSLIPWIIKQTQKGPPDAWFGYTPPPRQPKKILGIFKRKSAKTSSTVESTRAQQLQLGDELLRRSTPLLYRRSSNLSVSPANSTASFADVGYQQSLVGSPTAITNQDIEDYDDYFTNRLKDEYHDDDNELSNDISSSHHSSPNESYSSSNGPVTPTRSQTSIQPVSILKKSNNVKHEHIQQPKYSNPHSYCEESIDPVAYDNEYCSNEDDNYVDIYDEPYVIPGTRSEDDYYDHDYPHRPMSTTMIDDYHYQNRSHRTPSMMKKRSSKGRINHSNMNDNCFVPESTDTMYCSPDEFSTERRMSYRRNKTSNSSSRYPYRYDGDDYYYDDQDIALSQMSNSNRRRSFRNNDIQYHHLDYDNVNNQDGTDDGYYEDVNYRKYYSPPQDIRKNNSRRMSSPIKISQKQKRYQMAARRSQQEYHYDVSLSHKRTSNSLMLEEWEVTLDDLCSLFPRMDRQYINEFLKSAKGDFVTAKNMIMEMIMGD
ncbi:MAG: hypothetical protein EXX96DRAFT_584933 [Benjaminiella poitrasii]|nr:MAG: hypothetical protein EXX96DRAFT_584933 [Benjaminiella poitrasii]